MITVDPWTTGRLRTVSLCAAKTLHRTLQSALNIHSSTSMGSNKLGLRSTKASIYWKTIPAYKQTCTIQTHVVQGSIQYGYFCHRFCLKIEIQLLNTWDLPPHTSMKVHEAHIFVYLPYPSHVGSLCPAHIKIPDSQEESQCSESTILFTQTVETHPF